MFKKFFRFFLSTQSPLQFFVGLTVKGSYVGEDQFGNQYYRGKKRKGYTHERRWVVYQSGNVDASEVPPEFHGWLHHQTDVFPDADKGYRKDWIKPYEPNKTGTTLAYRPPGYKGKRAKVTGDYEAWTPE
jgi:NADH:ubiquinone oxidoreductase subunit